MRSAALWMMVTAVLILAYVWQEQQIYMPNPEPWPTVSGTIIFNEIHTINAEDDQRFEVLLRYRYKNADAVIEGNRITPARITYSARKQAEQAARAFPVGKEVKVYVNPVEKSNPPSVLVWQFPKILSPVIFIVIGLLVTSLILYLFSEYKKSRE